MTTVFLQVLLAKEANESGVPHHCVLAHRVVQVQVSSYDVQLDSQKNHQHAGAVHAHDGAGETWTRHQESHMFDVQSHMNIFY